MSDQQHDEPDDQGQTPPQTQRLAAYALVVRDEQVLLSLVASHIRPDDLWTLPGGGVEHGEHPREAVVREVHEETGLSVTVGETNRVISQHRPDATWADGRRRDFHHVRMVFEGWVPRDSPAPRTVEVGGSTRDAAWLPLADVLAGRVPVDALVREALAGHAVVRHQRLSAYALLRRDDRVLLTRVSARGAHPGAWTLPGGGVEHGEDPAAALVREVGEETGLEVAPAGLLTVHDTHFTGTAPSGRTEDFHGVHLVYAATLTSGDEPAVAEEDGTTDEAAWHPVTDVLDGEVGVLDVVLAALRADAGPA
ncbi:NUDIX hydrolase [Nocardioides bruguierae]|uniref:NUDIX hydrolase n=1 Tax=Nocardioides bruguierae TaxID=2945102 RepID=UPI0027E18854|nr:NUDIX domain-containing protein [Nocardioides bruguierae]